MNELDKRFKPLTRDDFHPWKDMMGADWDNEHRFDGWGAGEWCELICKHLQFINLVPINVTTFTLILLIKIALCSKFP